MGDNNAGAVRGCIGHGPGLNPQTSRTITLNANGSCKRALLLGGCNADFTGNKGLWGNKESQVHLYSTGSCKPAANHFEIQYT